MEEKEKKRERLKPSQVLGLSITIYIFAVIMGTFAAEIFASYMGNDAEIYYNMQSIITAAIVIPIVYRLLRDGELWAFRTDSWRPIIKYAAVGMLLVYGISWMMEYGFIVLELWDHESVTRLNELNDRGSGSNIVLQILGGAAAPAICEELLFRGALFGVLRVKRGFFFSAVISSIIFGVLHDLGIYAIYGFLIGMVLCLIMEITGSIAAPILLHFCNNLLAVIADMMNGESRLGTSVGFENAVLNWTVFFALLAGVVIVFVLLFRITGRKDVGQTTRQPDKSVQYNSPDQRSSISVRRSNPDQRSDKYARRGKSTN